LAQEMTQIFPDCKIVYSSGYAGNQIIRNGELKAGIHFVHKPYSPRDMLKKIREVLDEGKKRS
jgi:two-component system, cell cycle sensor histidine kinase and response regulator CckA